MIEDLTCGNDELVRSAIIITKARTSTRRFVKLYSLEINSDTVSRDGQCQPNNDETTKGFSPPGR